MPEEKVAVVENWNRHGEHREKLDPTSQTKQAFRDQCDINKLLAKAARGDSISHLAKHGAVYGDFTDMPDLMEAQDRLAKGQAIFDELPGELRREFDQSPAKFFEFVNDPNNMSKLGELLPALAAPGDNLPAMLNRQPGRAAPGQTQGQTPPVSPAEPQAAPQPPSNAE